MKKFFEKILKQGSHRHIIDREQRRDLRIRASEDFIIEYQAESMRTGSIGEGRDLSVSGVKFAVPRKLKKGEHLAILIVFNSKFKAQRKLALEGEVRNVQRPRGARRYRIHCQFVNQTGESRQVLSRFMEWLKTGSG